MSVTDGNGGGQAGRPKLYFKRNASGGVVPTDAADPDAQDFDADFIEALISQARADVAGLFTGGNPPVSPVKQETSDEDLVVVLQNIVEKIDSDRELKEREKEARTFVNKNLKNVFTKLDTADLPEATKQSMYRSLQEFATDYEVGLKVPSSLVESRLMTMSKPGEDPKGVVSKIVSRIPKFDGKSTEYTWSHFLTCFSIAVSNASYQDYELRAIFLSCLEGNALEHYRAHLDEYSALGYEDLVAKFEERYGEKKRVGLNDLVGISQAVNEDVYTFRDRLLNTASPLMPTKPVRKLLFRAEGQAKPTVIDNIKYDAEMQLYLAKKKQHDLYLIRFFVLGLRSEILGRLQTTDFDTLDAAVEAAYTAEDYLKSIQQAKTYHLQAQASVNNIRPRTRSSSRESRGSSRDVKSPGKRTGTKKGRCRKCGKEGHWAQECWSSSDKSHGFAAKDIRPRTGFSTDSKQLEKELEIVKKQLAQLQTSMGRNRSSYSRSRSRGRDRSRGQKRSRSHSRSSYHSRSNSRGRSQSPKNWRR